MTGPDKAPRLVSSGLQLGDKVVPLYCGAVHYFRLKRAMWRRALEETRALGLPIVETYVPWGVHELSEGQYDFGQQNPCLDLIAFIDLAHELGLYVFLRPGPNVNAELAFFGLPRRVVMDPRSQAESSRGQSVPLPVPPRAFPVPSYASRHFRGEANRWLRAVTELTASRCWPNGPIALVQVDNEAALYFRDAPYDSDYHDDSLADFRAGLRARYGTPMLMSEVYRAPITDFDKVQPPTRFDAVSGRELPPYLDWMDHQQDLLSNGVAEFADTLRSAGFSKMPLVHNLPMGEGGLPASLSAIGKSIDLVGLDYYHGRDGLEAVRRRTQRLVGCATPAFAPELGVGAPPWFPLRRDGDSGAAALTACAFGLRGFNLYMTVDRDRWYGAPLDADGSPRPLAQNVRRLMSALERTEHHALRRKAQVALCIPTEYVRLSRAMHALGALTPSALDVSGIPPTSGCRTDPLGFERPIQLAWHALLMRLDEALCDEGVPFIYVEGESNLDAHPDLKVVITPTYEFADRARWQLLTRFAERGGKVVYGPRLPELDERVQPFAFAAIPNAELARVDNITDAKALVRSLVNDLQLARPFPVEPQPLRSAVHVDNEGRTRVLFLVHPGKDDVTAEVRVPGRIACVDAMTDERFEGDGTLLVPMRGRLCRMLILEGSSS
jgi:beta-galactosidase